MSTPYRDEELHCPSCKAALRPVQNRFACDSCGGMQLGLADLKRSVEELANASSELLWHGDAIGRGCPRCAAPMTVATVEIRFDNERLTSKHPYERCAEHGPWFDNKQLADVFLLVERRVHDGQPHNSGAPRYRWLSND